MNNVSKTAFVMTLMVSCIAGGLIANNSKLTDAERSDINSASLEKIFAAAEASLKISPSMHLQMNWNDKQQYKCPNCLVYGHVEPSGFCAYQKFAQDLPKHWDRVRYMAYKKKVSPYVMLASICHVASVQASLDIFGDQSIRYAAKYKENHVPVVSAARLFYGKQIPEAFGGPVPKNVVSGPHAVITSNDENDVVEDVVSELELKEREEKTKASHVPAKSPKGPSDKLEKPVVVRFANGERGTISDASELAMRVAYGEVTVAFE